MGRNQLRKPAGISRIFHLAFSLIKILLAQGGFSAAHAAGKLNAASPARRRLRWPHKDYSLYCERL
jgi:hypothetical protein